MPVDASIPLQVKPPNIMSLADLMNAQAGQQRNQLLALQLGEQQRSQQDNNALRSAFMQPGSIGPDGSPTNSLLAQMAQSGNVTGYKMAHDMQASGQEKQAIAAWRTQEAAKSQFDMMTARQKQIVETGQKVYDEAKLKYEQVKTELGPEAAQQAGTEVLNRYRDQYQKDGSFGTNWEKIPTSYDDAHITSSLSHPIMQFIASGTRAAAKPAKWTDADGQSYRPGTSTPLEVFYKPENKWVPYEGKPDGLTSIGAKGTTSGGDKAPSGYRWSTEKQGELEPIPGGPASGTKQGAREAVFTQRVITSANEAARDLENVVQLPMSVSTGLLGGRKQGPGLFDATREVLANKMTSQEVQSYNVMATGFQRSLATIESAGLAPAGSLTHQMDAVLFKEGDSNLTKLQKLAQTRQIVEAGMEVVANNPRASDKEREQAKKIIESMDKSVPFTHRDLMMLNASNSPNITLKEIIGKKNASAPAAQSIQTTPATAGDYSHLWR